MDNKPEVRTLLKQIENKSIMMQWIDDMNKRNLKVMFCFALDEPGNSEVYSTIDIDKLIFMLESLLKTMKQNKPIQLIG